MAKIEFLMVLQLNNVDEISRIYDICDKTSGVFVFYGGIRLDCFLSFDKMAEIVDYLRSLNVKSPLNKC